MFCVFLSCVIFFSFLQERQRIAAAASESRTNDPPEMAESAVDGGHGHADGDGAGLGRARSNSVGSVLASPPTRRTRSGSVLEGVDDGEVLPSAESCVVS